MEAMEQKLAVRWADLDPNGHVRHSIYYGLRGPGPHHLPAAGRLRHRLDDATAVCRRGTSSILAFIEPILPPGAEHHGNRF